MTNLKSINWKAKAAALDVKLQQTEFESYEGHRVQAMVLSRLRSALCSVAQAARDMARLMTTQNEVLISPFAQRLSTEIEEFERFFALVDIENLKTDAKYAGGFDRESRILELGGQNLCKLSEALLALSLACNLCAVARSEREAFYDPARPKKQYAVARENFTGSDDGGPLFYNRGYHYDIDRREETGVVVSSGGWSVFFADAEFKEKFEIVER